MISRRAVLRCATVSVLAAVCAPRLGIAAAPAPPGRVWLPLVQATADAPSPVPPSGTIDAPLLASPSGTAEQAIGYLDRRALLYTTFDIASIVAAYQAHAEPVGVDWFLALAQLAHETGSLTSWWSQRPRRNPAGIGVTGRTQPGSIDAPPAGDWAWHNNQWEEGVSFATWADDAVPAHIGRLLAYALRDDQMTAQQQTLAARALAVRALPDALRGSAGTIIALNGRWAYPGTTYGQMIIALAQRMREGL